MVVEVDVEVVVVVVVVVATSFGGLRGSPATQTSRSQRWGREDWPGRSVRSWCADQSTSPALTSRVGSCS